MASISTGRDYRPVAGMAAVDAGNGTLIVMNDDTAFHHTHGGAYHCWIESAPGDDRELIDFTIGHNHLYAQANGLTWLGGDAPAYLWGPYDDLALSTPLADLRPGFGKHRIWLQKTAAGRQWMEQHIADHAGAYVELTSEALRHYRSMSDDVQSKLPLSV